MQEVNFDEAVDQILTRDVRYVRDAYFFVQDAVRVAKKQVHKENNENCQEKHVTPHELLDGIRQLALNQFGPMVVTVFDEWGIHHCKDFGDIVFNMFEANLLTKTEKDNRDDFQNGYDFTDAFCKPFWPEARRQTVPKSMVQ